MDVSSVGYVFDRRCHEASGADLPVSAMTL